MTFASGEAVLSQWMRENAFVAWQVCPDPWVTEAALLARISLPLNLEANRHHAFHPVLTDIRRAAKSDARRLPVVS